MEAIADRAFLPGQQQLSYDESPSLLTFVIDANPAQWCQVFGDVPLAEVLKSIMVAINAHLSLNSNNKVAVLSANSRYSGSQFLFPNDGAKIPSNSLSSEMYRQFRVVDETLLHNLNALLSQEPADQSSRLYGTLSGSLSMALAYMSKMSTGAAENDGTPLRSRIVVVSVSDDSSLHYISMMNCIFAAQKMKTPIDVCKLHSNSIFLQQAADSTGGTYLSVKNPQGLIQYLTSALFVDPNIRNFVVLPTNAHVDFRASCFITGKIIDTGYVCSVCLCILSLIPKDAKCPTCQSEFDKAVLTKLLRRPPIARKRIA